MSLSGQRLVVGALVCLPICLGAHAADGDLEAARKCKTAAVEHLRKADEPGADRGRELKAAAAKLVKAQKILAAFDEPVPPEVETELTEINSLIYWTRKMTPLDSGGAPGPAPRRTPRSRAKPRTTPGSRTSAAKRNFEAAQRYAEGNLDKPFLIAIKYFEVASRFEGTSWSIKAQRLALDYQKKAFAAARRGKPTEAARTDLATRKPTAARPDVKKPLARKRVLSEYSKLKLALKNNTSRAKKIKACEAYLERAPEGSRGNSEVKAVAEALAAESGEAGTLTWIDYLVSYPQGLMMGRALDALRLSEDAAFDEIGRSMVVDDIDRALRISRACLRALPGKSWGREVKSLIAVLKLQPGEPRTRLVRNHMRGHPRGRLTRTLREVAKEWGRADELDAFDRLFWRFTGTKSRRERGLAVREFLDSYSGGLHSTEVKALSLAVTPTDPRKRLKGARRYLDDYPEGAFRDEARELAGASVEEVNAGLFAKTMKTSSDRRIAYKERLAATGRYLEEFPDGDRARRVRAAAEEVRALIKEEARVYEELTATLKNADTEAALRACGVFLTKHARGAHGPEVMTRRDDYGMRLNAEKEANAYRALVAGIGKPSLSRIGKAKKILGFLGRFRQGRHNREARARLRKLAPGRLESLTGPVRTAAFSSDSTTLVMVDADASLGGTGIWVWNVPEEKLTARYQASSGFSACSVAFGPGDKEFWVGESSGGLIAWDVSSGRILGRYRIGCGPVAATAAVGNGALAITASLGDAKLRLWTSADWSLSDSFSCEGDVSSAASSPSGDVIAVGQRDGGIVCFQGLSSTTLWTESGAHARAVGHLCFSPKGTYVASCSPDAGTVSLRDARTGKVIWEVRDPTPTVAFAGATGVLTSAGIRNMDSGSLRVKLGGSGPVAASPDGQFALTTDRKGGGTLWYLPALLQ